MAESRRRIDTRKVALVGELLMDAYPGLEVQSAYDFNRSAQFYRVAQGTQLVHRIYVSREFFDDHAEEEIRGLLKAWRAKETIEAAGARAVIVTNGGISVPGTRLGNEQG